LSNYDHKQLLNAITSLNDAPANSDDFSKWISAESHLLFLRENSRANEIVIIASGRNTYINSVIVQNIKLSPIDKDDLLGWNMNPYIPFASYVTGSKSDEIWIERGIKDTGSNALDGATQLIYGRIFRGWTGAGRNYYEVHPEYTHLSDIHWCSERQAYCRFNSDGDIEDIVSITISDTQMDKVNLVSFNWNTLEEYLVCSDTSLVRMFDFTLYRPLNFTRWSDGLPEKFIESDILFYKQKVMPGVASYTRGVQIISPRQPKTIVSNLMRDKWQGKTNREYAEFIALDWRNERITKISTKPGATANYFNAEGNSLPFELSPAFFKPEVLLRYKADHDKYLVGEREISCRESWSLDGIDVNEAGQLHVYICDLRNLPYNEQLYWLSFNEPPKTGISKRAFTHDFKGEWTTFTNPLQEVLTIIKRWNRRKVGWWTLRDEMLLDRVNTPLTESRDEWAEAFMDLYKLIIEGLETKYIRAKLNLGEFKFEKTDGTILLLEKLLNNGTTTDDGKKLLGLRNVWLVRSKVKGHVEGREARELAKEAIKEHETFKKHFEDICALVADDLETIENIL